MLGRIGVFVLCLVIGMLILRFTYEVVKFTGKSEWAEGKTTGGTFTMWKLIALGIIVFGFFYLIGDIPSLSPTPSTEIQGIDSSL